MTIHRILGPLGPLSCGIFDEGVALTQHRPSGRHVFFGSASPVPKNEVTGWTHVKRKLEASHRCKALGSKQYIKVVVVAHARCYIMNENYLWLLAPNWLMLMRNHFKVCAFERFTPTEPQRAWPLPGEPIGPKRLRTGQCNREFHVLPSKP